MLVGVLKVLGVTALFATLTVQFGPEFFVFANTALNLVTVIYVRHTNRRVQHVDERVEEAAAALDTRLDGGRRKHDPSSSEDH